VVGTPIRVVDTRSMSDNQLAILTGRLRVARRNLAEDVPHSPAWAATTEWVDELEREIQELGSALGVIVSAALKERMRVA
jgi:hypothetical protein